MLPPDINPPPSEKEGCKTESNENTVHGTYTKGSIVNDATLAPMLHAPNLARPELPALQDIMHSSLTSQSDFTTTPSLPPMAPNLNQTFTENLTQDGPLIPAFGSGNNPHDMEHPYTSSSGVDSSYAQKISPMSTLTSPLGTTSQSVDNSSLHTAQSIDMPQETIDPPAIRSPSPEIEARDFFTSAEEESQGQELEAQLQFQSGYLQEIMKTNIANLLETAVNKG